MIPLLSILLFLNLFYAMFMLIIRGGLKSILNHEKNDYRPGSVTVIIPFRDEAENIVKNLKSIEKQNMDGINWEVVYVDDNSADGSAELLKSNINNGNIRIIESSGGDINSGHKKRAIQTGIENSEGELIVITDSDCWVSENWLLTVISSFDAETGFVTGPVAYSEEKSLFSRIQQYDFGGIVLAGAGLIGSGKPVICNSANLAFKREVFVEAGGFGGLMGFSSGDDDLLMQKVDRLTEYKVKSCFDNKALVSTRGTSGMGEFMNQRRRWGSKTIFYKDPKIVLSLLMLYFYFLTFPLQLILGVSLSPIFFFTFILSFLIKIFMEYGNVKAGLGILYSKIDIPVLILAEFFQIYYMLVAPVLGLFGNFEWKGRKLKR